MHHYPDPQMPAKPEEKIEPRCWASSAAWVLPIDGHMWTAKHWGYRGVADQNALTDSYVKMLAHAWELKKEGLSAVVYTQTTDVETESNGLMTYDREVFKVEPQRAATAARGELPGNGQ